MTGTEDKVVRGEGCRRRAGSPRGGAPRCESIARFYRTYMMSVANSGLQRTEATGPERFPQGDAPPLIPSDAGRCFSSAPPGRTAVLVKEKP